MRWDLDEALVLCHCQVPVGSAQSRGILESVLLHHSSSSLLTKQTNDAGTAAVSGIPGTGLRNGCGLRSPLASTPYDLDLQRTQNNGL